MDVCSVVPSRHGGRNCEVNQWEDRCRAHSSLCKGDSRCADLNDGGFGCENCSHASWSTRQCELRARSFTRGSFLTFPSLRQRHRLHIKLRFVTREKNALILYNGRYNDQHDFIAMEIIEGQLVVSFSLGANVSEVSAKVPGGLNDGQWHEAELSYLNRGQKIPTLAGNAVSFPASHSGIHQTFQRTLNIRSFYFYRFFGNQQPPGADLIYIRSFENKKLQQQTHVA
ncbi:protocadherin-like wing polarity protein stan [Trichonephila clavipes]|nr:protocadherin-like wing polarity protein stan [Trichonephila clavipes]